MTYHFSCNIKCNQIKSAFLNVRQITDTHLRDWLNQCLIHWKLNLNLVQVYSLKFHHFLPAVTLIQYVRTQPNPHLIEATTLNWPHTAEAGVPSYQLLIYFACVSVWSIITQLSNCLNGTQGKLKLYTGNLNHWGRDGQQIEKWKNLYQ